MSASYRHLARIAVMQVLFANDFRPDSTAQTLDYILKENPYKIDKDFAQNLLQKILEKCPQLEETIIKHAPQWPLDKIAPLDRNILKIGIYELLFSNTPPRVVINEAIEIGKQFGGDKTAKFVNGVLNAVYEKNQSS